MKSIILVIMFLFVSNVWATTYYVDNTTNNTCSNGETDYDPKTDECDGEGSFTVYDNIKDGHDALSAGDELLVATGIYPYVSGGEILEIGVNGVNGTIGQLGNDTLGFDKYDPDTWVLIKSESKWGAVFDCEETIGSYGFTANANASYMQIEDLVVKNCAWTGMGTNSADSDNLRFVGNHIHDIGRFRCTDDSNGIVGMNSRGSYITFDSNNIHDVGRLWDGEDGCSTEDNIYETNDHGFYLHDGGPTNILNNVTHGHFSGWSLQLYQSGGPTFEDINIINNTFSNTNTERNGNINLWNSMENVKIHNNIFNGGTNYGMRINSPITTNVTVRNNLTDNTSLYDNAKTITFSDNITSGTVDFVDGYHIGVNSDAIYSGLDTYAPELDHDLNIRADPPSIGACAYCPGLVVRESNSYEYITILSAYYASSNDETLLMPENTIFIGDMDFGRNVTVTLEGGLTCDLTSQVSNTMINGNVTISSGTVVMDNIEIF